MSMSTHLDGFKKPDEKWKKMKAVWDACEVANVPVPDDVTQFFEGDDPREEGVEVRLRVDNVCVRKVEEDCRDGFLVDLEALRLMHPDLTILKFYNSY